MSHHARLATQARRDAELAPKVATTVVKRSGSPGRGRKTITTIDQRWRERIQTGAILNRLHRHIKGQLEMRNSQIRAALGLLSKVLPDLQSIDLAASVTVRNTVRATPLTPAEFEAQFCQPESQAPMLELEAIARPLAASLELAAELEPDDDEPVMTWPARNP